MNYITIPARTIVTMVSHVYFQELIKALDRDGDSKVTLDEFTNAIAQIQAQQ